MIIGGDKLVVVVLLHLEAGILTFPRNQTKLAAKELLILGTRVCHYRFSLPITQYCKLIARSHIEALFGEFFLIYLFQIAFRLHELLACFLLCLETLLCAVDGLHHMSMPLGSLFDGFRIKINPFDVVFEQD